jgi:hypothetical protein
MATARERPTGGGFTNLPQPGRIGAGAFGNVPRAGRLGQALLPQPPATGSYPRRAVRNGKIRARPAPRRLRERSARYSHPRRRDPEHPGAGRSCAGGFANRRPEHSSRRRAHIGQPGAGSPRHRSHRERPGPRSTRTDRRRERPGWVDPHGQVISHFPRCLAAMWLHEPPRADRCCTLGSAMQRAGATWLVDGLMPVLMAAGYRRFHLLLDELERNISIRPTRNETSSRFVPPAHLLARGLQPESDHWVGRQTRSALAAQNFRAGGVRPDHLQVASERDGAITATARRQPRDIQFSSLSRCLVGCATARSGCSCVSLGRGACSSM